MLVAACFGVYLMHRSGPRPAACRFDQRSCRLKPRVPRKKCTSQDRERRVQPCFEGFFTIGVLASWHETLDDLDWAFDCLCAGDHHPGLWLAAGCPLRHRRVGVRALFGPQAPACAAHRAVGVSGHMALRGCQVAREPVKLLVLPRRIAPMANKEQRSNREKRKPKKEKPKPAPQVSGRKT
jgi:hypothetical protein